MKKIISLLLALSMIFALAACGSNGDGTDATTPTETGKKVYNIGIVQLVQHEALDAATKGFRDALVEELGEDAVVFDEQNASGDPQSCATIVNGFVSKNVDLIMANATDALAAAHAATSTIPILGTSITEYGVALGIDGFDGTVGGNISGTSDLAPLDKQAEMIMELYPDAKKVGLIYCSAEPNSDYQVKVVKEYLEGKGLECKEFSFSDSNDIAAVTQTACDYSDVIYVPTDNTAASSAATIDGVCRPAKVPVIAGEEGICANCGVATLSISYYELGKKTGKMAARILRDGEDISTMPIEYDENYQKKYNPEICEELGLTVPEDYVAIE